MKLSTISIALVLVGCTGVAFAAGQNQVLPEVTVTARNVSACTPPNGNTGHACDSYDQFLRANFTPRQIGMLFGYETSYPEYLTGGIDRLQHRYQALLQRFVASPQALNGAFVPMKN